MEVKTEGVIGTIQKNTTDETNVIHKEINDPYGFVYITTNLVNGKRYLGQKGFNNKPEWANYIGSGVAFLNAVKKYGRENFTKNIIDIAYSNDELNQKEYEYSVFFDVVESSDWYNLAYGGNVPRGYRYSDEQRAARSESLKGHFVSAETREKISKKNKERLSDPKKHPFYGDHRYAGENNPFFGKRHTAETKAKISSAHLGKNTGIYNKKSTMVFCVNTGEIFQSQSEARITYNIDINGISHCVNGKQKTAGKHPVTGEPLLWKYVYDQEKKDGTTILGAITLGYITEERISKYLNNLK